MIPILNFAWSGYLVGILRNVMYQAAEPLPTWNDLDKQFRDGLTLFIAGVVYALPILISLCLPLSMAAFSGFLSGTSNLQDIRLTFTRSEVLSFICLLSVLMLYGIGLSVMYPAFLVLFAREGTLHSCFKLQEAFSLIRKNAAAFLTAWALSWIASLSVGLLVGFINVVVGWVPLLGWVIGFLLSLGSGVYTTVVYAHLFGQFGRIAYQVNY